MEEVIRRESQGDGNMQRTQLDTAGYERGGEQMRKWIVCSSPEEEHSPDNTLILAQ